MKTEKLAHWAEIISGLVVIVTLIFLIQEIKDNTRAVQRQTDLDRAAAFTTPFFVAPELASVIAKIKEVDGADPLPEVYMEEYGLTHAEATLWERHLWFVWLGLEAEFEQNGESEEVASSVSALLSTHDNELYWEVLGSSHDTEFRTFVDALAAELETGM